MLIMKELVKDMGNLKGDIAQNYRTIAVEYGERMSKKLVSILVFVSGIPLYLLLNTYRIGGMRIFFYASIFLLILFLVALWRSKGKVHYVWLHNILKFIIVSGVFSIVLIDFKSILDKILSFL